MGHADGTSPPAVLRGRMDPDAQREHPLVNELSDLQGRSSGLLTAFAVLRLVRKGQTRAGKPYLDVRLADRSRTVAAKVWSDAGRAMQTAEQLRVGTHVKVLFELDTAARDRSNAAEQAAEAARRDYEAALAARLPRTAGVSPAQDS